MGRLRSLSIKAGEGAVVCPVALRRARPGSGEGRKLLGHIQACCPPLGRAELPVLAMLCQKLS